jgi:hypothetical protein
LLLLAGTPAACADKPPAEKLRDQILERLEEGGVQARAEQGSVTWSFGQGGPVRVGYDFETGGEPFIPFPLVVDGERLYLSGQLMDGADPEGWILLTPGTARDLWQDENLAQADRQLAQTILAFVRYSDPRALLVHQDLAGARLESRRGVTRLSGTVPGEALLGDEVPAEARKWLQEELAFPRELEVVLEVDEDGRPRHMTSGGTSEGEGRQTYTWEPGPLEVPVPRESTRFRDWLASR